MLVQAYLEHNTKARADKTALVCGGKRFTYADLDKAANRLANTFRQQGVQRGDRVGLYLGNSFEAVAGIFAALKADAVFVALNRATKPEKVLSILNNCQAAIVLLDARSLAQGIGDRVFTHVPSV